jgi:hypothetical protein
VGGGRNTAETRKLVCPSLQSVFKLAVSIFLSATAAVRGSLIIEFASDELEALAQAMVQVRMLQDDQEKNERGTRLKSKCRGPVEVMPN